MTSIYELSTYYDYDYGSISIDALEDIQGGSQIHPDTNARYSRLKIRDRIKQMQNEWKGA